MEPVSRPLRAGFREYGRPTRHGRSRFPSKLGKGYKTGISEARRRAIILCRGRMQYRGHTPSRGRRPGAYNQKEA